MGALQITIPRWNITEMNGYEPITILAGLLHC